MLVYILNNFVNSLIVVVFCKLSFSLHFLFVYDSYLCCKMTLIVIDIFCNCALIFCLFWDAPLWHRRLMLFVTTTTSPFIPFTWYNYCKHALAAVATYLYLRFSILALLSSAAQASSIPVVERLLVSQMSFCKNIHLCASDQFHGQPHLCVSTFVCV